MPKIHDLGVEFVCALTVSSVICCELWNLECAILMLRAGDEEV